MTKTWVALALILIGGRVVLRLSVGPKRSRRLPRTSPADPLRERIAGPPTVEPPEAPATPPNIRVATGSTERGAVEYETIILSEPLPPELASPARRARRAARLAVAIVWVSVLLAVGLLVFVKVLVAMFGRLGG